VEHKKSFVLTQGAIIGLMAVAGTAGLGFLISAIVNSSTINKKQNLIIDTTSVKAGTQQRLDNIKTIMQTSWQTEARAKGFSFSWIPQRFQGIVLEDAKLTKSPKVIALTFDDGPNPPYTTEILDILKKNNIKSTFFVIGQNAKVYPEYLKRIVAEGHAIGNHTWHHWYHHMSPQVAAYEIDNTNKVIQDVTGVKTNLFRPPGGHLTNGLASYAKNQKFGVIMWSSDSIDYRQPAVPSLLKNILRNSKSGGIVLMHDGGGKRGNTVKALPELIETYKKQGYSFVTVPELLEMQEKEQKNVTAMNK
jgi:peptidoglycan-N-acetylglucosamine deacetylase